VGRQFREAHRGDSARLGESLLTAIRKREDPEDVTQSRDDHGALASARRGSMKRPGRLSLFSSAMQRGVAFSAKRNQVRLRIVARLAAKLLVVNLKVGH
jgi:hypothetical protein